MNVMSLMPALQNKQNTNVLNLNNNTVIYPKYLNVLDADIVSFSGQIAYRGTSIINDAMEQSYKSGLNQFKTEVRKFHKALKTVCEKMKDEGFYFDESYNSKHPVKTLDSFMDKCRRKGNATDKMRATAYWINQQDVEAFSKFVKLMDEENYKISSFTVKNPLTNKLEKRPDIEIRQENINKEDLKMLGPFLSKAEISRPRNSTYADWQMRFRPKDKKDIEIELIMLYGKNYAAAKELESRYVYNITRALEKIHIDMSKNYSERNAGRRIKNNLDVIKTRLREDISRPLFINAKNQDLKLKEIKVPVGISKIHSIMLDGYMSNIRAKLPVYYKELAKEIKSNEFIINYIKTSPEYKLRLNKTITPEEIITVRKQLLDELPLYKADDIGTITTAHEMLKTTIERFGEK